MNENIPQAMPPEIPRPPSDDAPAASRKKKAKWRLVVIAVAVVLGGSALWYFQRYFSLPLQSLTSFENSVHGLVGNLPKQNFSAPSPLQQVTKAVPKKTNALTSAGVVVQTNIQRAQNGNLPPLTENATLDAIATLRLDDLFQQQYFEHVGPQGESAITVASSVGYASLALGENLALGLYAGDAGVVDAWMKSPGHRANILDIHYTQIGVAAREGMFQGQNTWIAVQVFGRPASDCPAPDINLKTSIDLSESQISAMASQLASDKATLDAMNPQSGPQYNAEAQNYNNLAEQYNNLTAEVKTAIGVYDSEVSAFNTCLGQ